MIRDATIDDLPALVCLGRAMHAESPRFRKLRYDEQRAEGFLRWLLSGPHGMVAVADIDGRLVGGMAAMCVEHWCSPILVASDVALFVLPEHRGSITAARLIARFRQWARRRGAVLATVGISTGVHVDESQALYLALGAEHVGPLLEFRMEA